MNFRPIKLMFPALLLSASIASADTIPTYHEIARVKLSGSQGWDYLNIAPAAHRLYITRGTHVDVMNLDTNKIIGQIKNTPGVHGVALAEELNRGFTSNGQNNTVTIFDLKTLNTLGTVSVGNRPDAIVYDPATKRVFTMNGGSDNSTAIDASTGNVEGTIALDGRPEFATADGKGEVFVNIESKSEISAIDATALTVKATWPIAPGVGPSGIAMDSDSRRIFSVCGNKMMVVLDADSGKALATPAIGQGPDACWFDPGDHLAFSSNGRDGTLTVVQEESPDQFSVVATVPTEAGARTLAVDTLTHKIYLITAKFTPAAPGEPFWRRKVIPGSVVVLVYAP